MPTTQPVIARLRHAGRLALLGLLLCGPASAQYLPAFDFRQPAEVARWRADHDISAIVATAEGMEVTISGTDPYLHGPAADYPAGQPLWVTLELKADRSGMGQLFYYREGTGASEANSVRFPVECGAWRTVRFPLPPFWARTVLRLDPPGDGGKAVYGSIRFAPRTLLQEPNWPAPEAPALDSASPAIRSGVLALRHARDRFGAYRLTVEGQDVAIGHSRPLIGYLFGGQLRWLDVAAKASVSVREAGDGFTVSAEITDPDGGTWWLDQRFRPDDPEGIDVVTTVRVSHEREAVFLPMLMVFPGAGSFGAGKAQALFAGLEYLDADEPSSSEKDIIGPGSQRQVPDNLKVTFPLMAVNAGGKTLGLAWQEDTRFSAVFDSPDRLFGSGGHVMGAVFPGSDGLNRQEGDLLPYAGETLRPDAPLVHRATLMGASAGSVVPAIEGYVARYRLPLFTRLDLWGTYARTASAGWLDSGIRVGGLYRHAWPGTFGAQPAADAAVWMDYLARQIGDAALRARLAATATEARAQVPLGQLNSAGVGHIRYPVPALVYRQAARNAVTARNEGNGLLQQFQPDGGVLYVPPSGGTDLGSTHWSREASGLAGGVVAAVLDRALVCGDPTLIREGLRVLRALERFDDTVPRGAQTWEVPLHTPDILGAANLVKAFTTGYELTGDAGFLARARYWAWTGVPFVYLAPEIRPAWAFGTIPVYGSTQWTAMNWMGLPVQWCGLVYADALARLARYDGSGPWRRIADGIAASGAQQTQPIGLDPMRQGLLPDSYQLRSGLRNDVHINPGTLLPPAIRLYRRPDIYDYRVFRVPSWIAHAPGRIAVLDEQAGKIRFRAFGWPEGAYEVLVSGVTAAPRVRINGQDVPLAAPHAHDAANGLLTLQVTGHPVIEVSGG